MRAPRWSPGAACLIVLVLASGLKASAARLTGRSRLLAAAPSPTPLSVGSASPPPLPLPSPPPKSPVPLAAPPLLSVPPGTSSSPPPPQPPPPRPPPPNATLLRDVIDPTTGCPEVPAGFTFAQGLDHWGDDFTCLRWKDVATWSIASQAAACLYNPWCKGFNADSAGSCIKQKASPLLWNFLQVPCFGFYQRKGVLASPWPDHPPSPPSAPPPGDPDACPAPPNYRLAAGMRMASATYYDGAYPGSLMGAAAACDMGFDNPCWGFDSRTLRLAFSIVMAPDATAGRCDGVYLNIALEQQRINVPPPSPPLPMAPPPSPPITPSLPPGPPLLPPSNPPPPNPPAPPPPVLGTAASPPAPALLSASSGSSSIVGPAAAGIAAGIVALAAVVAVLFVRRRRRRQREALPFDKADSSGPSGAYFALHLGHPGEGDSATPLTINELGGKPAGGLWARLDAAVLGKRPSPVDGRRSHPSNSHASQVSIAQQQQQQQQKATSATWSAAMLDGGTQDRAFSDDVLLRVKDSVHASGDLDTDSKEITDIVSAELPAANNNPEVLTAQMLTYSSRLKDEQLEVFEMLGRGGSGTVYRALWKGLPVAAKMMILHEDSQEKARRQMLEATMSTGLSHPNIVNTYMFDLKPLYNTAAPHDDPRRWRTSSMLSKTWQLVILQELCLGGTLRHYMNSDALNLRTSSDERLHAKMVHILHIALDVATGLEHLHSKNIVHSDLTPSNVLMQAAGTASRPEGLPWVAKVADFGLSIAFEEGHSHVSRVFAGTPHYIAPETQGQGILSKQSDMFTYGVMLYEMVAGSVDVLKASVNMAPPPPNPFSHDAAPNKPIAAHHHHDELVPNLSLDAADNDSDDDGGAAAAVAAAAAADAHTPASDVAVKGSATHNTATLKSATSGGAAPGDGGLCWTGSGAPYGLPRGKSCKVGSANHQVDAEAVVKEEQEDEEEGKRHGDALMTNTTSTSATTSTIGVTCEGSSSDLHRLSAPSSDIAQHLPPGSTDSNSNSNDPAAGVASSQACQPLLGGGRGRRNPNVLPALPHACPAAYRALVRACLSQSPALRPTVGQVRQQLMALIEELSGLAHTLGSEGSATACMVFKSGGSAAPNLTGSSR